MVSNFSLDYEVCNCKKITINDIFTVIRTKEANTLGKIQELTSLGTQCRCCMFKEADTSKLKKKIYAKDVLNFYKDING